MAQTNTVARKKPVTHKDLTMLYMMNGANALDKFLVDHTDPVGVLNKVRETLSANSQDTGPIDEKIEFWTEKKQPGVKGRKPVAIGESRTYSVQQIGDDGDEFVRLPVSLLGLSKGSKVSALFADGQIIVTAVDA